MKYVHERNHFYQHHCQTIRGKSWELTCSNSNETTTYYPEVYKLSSTTSSAVLTARCGSSVQTMKGLLKQSPSFPLAHCSGGNVDYSSHAGIHTPLQTQRILLRHTVGHCRSEDFRNPMPGKDAFPLLQSYTNPMVWVESVRAVYG